MRITEACVFAVFAVACTGPQKKAAGPTGSRKAAPNLAAEAQKYLIGQICMTSAAGRPGVRALWTGGQSAWSAVEDGGKELLQRRAARRFSVIDWWGGRAGLFSVAGAGTTQGQVLAVGSYLGDPPCRRNKELDPACTKSLGDCGLAVAALEASGGYGARPFSEEPEPLELENRVGCVSGDTLSVDIDGDSRPESFALGEFLTESGEFADEIVTKAKSVSCDGALFATRSPSGVSVVSLADINGSGRAEILVSRGDASNRRWGLYAARGTGGSLSLVSEVELGGASAAVAPGGSPSTRRSEDGGPAPGKPEPSGLPTPR